jgi:hypothetical protein
MARPRARDDEGAKVRAMESRRRAALKAARDVVAHLEHADGKYYIIECDYADELAMTLHELDTELRRKRRLQAAVRDRK